MTMYLISDMLMANSMKEAYTQYEWIVMYVHTYSVVVRL